MSQREHIIQKRVVEWLRWHNVMVNVGLEGSYRTGWQGKALKDQGMDRGRPDILVILDGGRCVWIELKTVKGRLSEHQRNYHKESQNRGHEVHTVKAASSGEAIDKIKSILETGYQ